MYGLTKEEQKREILRCGKDPKYFIKKYTKIQHPVHGSIPFDTFDFQDDCVDSFEANRLNIILKSRQLGLSTISAAYAVWMAIFHRDKNILVIATKLPTAINFIKKTAFMIQCLPKWLVMPKYEPTKQAIAFSNGSQIKAIPTSPDAGRSEALSLLIIDEAAFIRDFDELWTGLAPTIMTGGQAIILSTPNGVGGQYYRLWTEAEAGVNGFNPIKIMWHQHPEHDQAWFDKETKSLPKKKIAQEYLCVGGATKIVTDSGYSRADQLKIGDLVLTHKGRFRPITAINSRLVGDSEKVYSVSSPGNRKDEFVLTGNHPMLSYRLWANNESTFDVLRSTPLEPTWIKADDVAAPRKTTDRIVNVLFPRFNPDAVKLMQTIDVSTLVDSVDVTDKSCRYHKQWGSTKRHIDVDFDLGKMVGLYLAEGCSHRGGIDLGFHKQELETHVAWVKTYLKNLGCRVTVFSPNEGQGCRLWTFNQHVGELMRSFVHDSVSDNGRRAPNKVLDMQRVLACGPDFIKGLLVGHQLGDGNHMHDKKTCAYSTSSKLVYQLRTLCSFFALYPRIGKIDHSLENPRHSDMWYLEFQAKNLSFEQLLSVGQQTSRGSRSMYLNNAFVGTHRLTDVTNHLQGDFRVYDISVADDRSFVAHSAVLHNCDFISSGDTFLQATDLEDIRTMIKDPIERAGERRDIWVWKRPIPGRMYVISADVARGDARDFSAFHIIDVEESEVVAEYMGRVPPEKMADIMAEWGHKYNDALAIPENNTFGYFVSTKLRDVGYKRLYYMSNKGDPYSYAPMNTEEVPGFITSAKSRVQILTKLAELIRNKVLKTYSQRLYSQLQAFIWNGNRPQAQKDNFDDLIMSLAIGCWLLDGSDGMQSRDKAMMYAMLEATSCNRRDKTQMPLGVNTLTPLVNPQLKGYSSHTVHRPRDASQVRSFDVADFRWLLR